MSAPLRRFRRSALCLGAGLLAALTNANANVNANDLATCSAIADANQRLACFDRLATQAATQMSSEVVAPAAAAKPPPPIQRRQAREAGLLDNPYSLTAYRPNYILPVTYNSKKNIEPFKQAYPDVGMDDIEAKFQISFKAQLWDINDKWNLWAAYTQENWWQVYNDDESAPFRETNYQPEIFAAYTPDAGFLGFNVAALTLGFNHQSNGRSEVLSRSWNRIIAGAALERGNWVMNPRVWWRIPEDDEDDDNPRTDDFYGYGDLRLGYNWNDMNFAALLRNNLRSDENRGAVQLDWTFPLNRRFKGYVQWFYGYGESMIDYDEKTNRIGIGVMLTDWL
jgi:phospholipase A1/A2